MFEVKNQSFICEPMLPELVEDRWKKEPLFCEDMMLMSGFWKRKERMRNRNLKLSIMEIHLLKDLF